MKLLTATILTLGSLQAQTLTGREQPRKVEQEPVQVELTSAPQVHPLVELYWQKAAEKAHRQAAIQSPVKPQFAVWAVSESYDGPRVFERLSRQIQDRPEQLLRYAVEITKLGNIDFLLPPPDGNAPKLRGHTGWRAYNLGAIRVSENPAVDADTREKARKVALAIAYRSAFSSPNIIQPTHPGWNNFKDPTFAREFSLMVLAHLNVLHLMPVDNKRDSSIKAVMRDLILDSYVRWFHKAGTSMTNEQLAEGMGWAPFMVAHCARALIGYHDSDFDQSYNSEIEEYVPILCDVVWERAYRETGDRFGLYNRPTADGNEEPAPDLSMFIMPMYAWAYKTTGDDKHRQRAMKLLESGLRFGWLDGHKQFCQSYLWSYDGLNWLNLL